VRNSSITWKEFVKRLKERGVIKSEKVEKAFLRCDRALFLPESVKQLAYIDAPLPIGCGKTISQPSTVAIMTELLEVKSENAVLEVGTGSGWQAAILSFLARRVVSVEVEKRLALRAVSVLKRLGRNNVRVVVGNALRCIRSAERFDRIIVTAACDEGDVFVFLKMLKSGGILVAPVGRGSFFQEMRKYIKANDEVVAEKYPELFSFIELEK